MVKGSLNFQSTERESDILMDVSFSDVICFVFAPLAVIGSVVFSSRAAHPSTTGVMGRRAPSTTLQPDHSLTIRTVTSTISSWQGKVFEHHRSRKILFIITRRFVRDRRCDHFARTIGYIVLILLLLVRPRHSVGRLFREKTNFP